MMPNNDAWQTSLHAFAQDHPTAVGHFPGNPIIPGALLLAHALRAMGTTADPTALRNTKFFAPVRPGDTVVFRWRTVPGGDRVFECRLRDSEQRVMSGSISFTDA